MPKKRTCNNAKLLLLVVGWVNLYIPVSLSQTSPKLAKITPNVEADHPVLDRTGLNGLFDFKLDPPSGDSREESKGDFQSGIFESVIRLGLKLESGKAPIETIVIDGADKPTEN